MKKLFLTLFISFLFSFAFCIKSYALLEDSESADAFNALYELATKKDVLTPDQIEVFENDFGETPSAFLSNLSETSLETFKEKWQSSSSSDLNTKLKSSEETDLSGTGLVNDVGVTLSPEEQVTVLKAAKSGGPTSAEKALYTIKLDNVSSGLQASIDNVKTLQNELQATGYSSNSLDALKANFTNAENTLTIIHSEMASILQGGTSNFTDDEQAIYKEKLAQAQGMLGSVENNMKKIQQIMDQSPNLPKLMVYKLAVDPAVLTPEIEALFEKISGGETIEAWRNSLTSPEAYANSISAIDAYRNSYEDQFNALANAVDPLADAPEFIIDSDSEADQWDYVQHVKNPLTVKKQQIIQERSNLTNQIQDLNSKITSTATEIDSLNQTIQWYDAMDRDDPSGKEYIPNYAKFRQQQKDALQQLTQEKSQLENNLDATKEALTNLNNSEAQLLQIQSSVNDDVGLLAKMKSAINALILKIKSVFTIKSSQVQVSDISNITLYYRDEKVTYTLNKGSVLEQSVYQKLSDGSYADKGVTSNAQGISLQYIVNEMQTSPGEIGFSGKSSVFLEGNNAVLDGGTLTLNRLRSSVKSVDLFMQNQKLTQFHSVGSSQSGVANSVVDLPPAISANSSGTVLPQNPPGDPSRSGGLPSQNTPLAQPVP